jgi:drug/metabolite transporter (DMT)-like permease
MLIGWGDLHAPTAVDPIGALILIVSTMSWAAVSLYVQKAHVSDDSLQASGMQMIGGGAWLLAAGLLSGEAQGFHAGHVSTTSLIALIYLAALGSIVAFTAYSWLLKVTTPARAATYAYVNPAVAVILGWAIAGEALTTQTVMSMCIIVMAVMVITTSKTKSH